MFNFLVSGDDEAWRGEPYMLGRSRVFEHTTEQVQQRFGELNDDQFARLYPLPTLFAFENGINKDARLGQVTRVQHRETRVRHGDRLIRIEYRFFEGAPPITPEMLRSLVWELDINDWELNRTHWAVKDVDLTAELLNASVLTKMQMQALTPQDRALLRELPESPPFEVHPSVFRLPGRGIEADLVSVMMPFDPAFDGVISSITQVCDQLGLRCKNANHVWDEPEIIQDIFSLLYRSKVVVCDFSGPNSNVFYETGIAHTLGRDVIPIVQNVGDIPFNLRHHRCIPYANNEQGLADLRSQITPRLATLFGVQRR